MLNVVQHAESCTCIVLGRQAVSCWLVMLLYIYLAWGQFGSYALQVHCRPVLVDGARSKAYVSTHV